MNRLPHLPICPKRPAKDVVWHVYRNGPREDAFLGAIDAPNHHAALALAGKRWPEHINHLHVGSEAFARKMLAKLNARVDRKPEIYAFHEAGHVAVARKFGWPVEVVSIRPELHRQGGNFHPWMDSIGRVSLDCRFYDLESPHHREEAEECILYALAGPTAEHRFRGRSRWHQQTDVAAISEFLLAHAPDEDEAEYLQDLKAGAVVLVDEVWSDIEAVAAALVEQRELSGAEVQRTVKAKSNTPSEKGATLRARRRSNRDQVQIHGLNRGPSPAITA